MKSGRNWRSLSLALILCTLGASLACAADTPAAASGYVAPKVTHEPYGDLRIVVALTSDDKKIQTMKLRNITNALQAVDTWHGHLKVKLVLYAKGVTLLKGPDAATREKLDALRARGVQIEVCNNSLSEQGIDFHTLYGVTDADIVPSGFAEVAFLQARKHYAVDPIN